MRALCMRAFCFRVPGWLRTQRPTVCLIERCVVLVFYSIPLLLLSTLHPLPFSVIIVLTITTAFVAQNNAERQ